MRPEARQPLGSDEANFLRGYRDTRRALRAATSGMTRVETSNHLFNEVIARSSSDMYMLVTPTEHGLYPYAGIPWYSTVFGRDGIITAMMLLWADPSIAKGVLRYLAAMQATDIDPAADAQPGKILHERRLGEMAQLGEVPFRRYYGTIDATPLFVMLAGQYYDRTGDRETLEAIWPNIEAALRWCDEFGDRDGDGFVEYHRETDKGLANQGWKDSHDSIFHADGSGAEGPIALCEVQAYVFAAKQAAARLAQILHRHDLSARLAQEAELLRERFEAAFWCEELGTYALALDGAKRAMPRADIQCGPCPVRRHCCARACPSGGGDPDEPGLVQRLGHPHRCAGRSALQSDVLPQWLDLAARQRDDRLGTGAVWLERGGRPDLQGAVRGGHVSGAAPPARTVLRVHAPAPSRADSVSGRLLAAGLGRGDALCHPRCELGTGPRLEGQCGSL